MRLDNLPSYLSSKDLENPEKLLQLLPQHPEDALLINQMLMFAGVRSGDAKQSIKAADYVIEHVTDSDPLSEAHYMKASFLKDENQFDEAIVHFKKAIELGGEDEGYIDNLADCYMSKNQFDEALKYFFLEEEVAKREAVEFEEEYEQDLWLSKSIGEAYFGKCEFEPAMKYFQKALDAQPEQVEFITAVGRAAASLGNNDKALEHFNKALELDPTDAYTYYYIGQSWQNKRDFFRAMHNYTEALKLKPDFPWVYNNIAGLYFEEEGDVKVALENMMNALEQAKKNDPRFLTLIYMNLSRLYNRIADYEQAEYYKARLLESLGFDVSEGDDDQDGDDDDNLAR